MDNTSSHLEEQEQRCSEMDTASQPAFSLVGSVILTGMVFFCPFVYSFRVSSFLHAKELVLSVGVILLGLLYIRRGVSLRALAVFLPAWLFLAYVTVIHIILKKTLVPEDALLSVVRGFVVLAAGTFAADVMKDTRWGDRIVLAAALSGAVAAVLAWVQYFDVFSFLFPTFTENAGPVYSVFGNPDLLGGYLAATVPILVYFILTYSQKSPSMHFRIVLVVAMLCATAGLVLSGSRGAWLAGAVGLSLVLFPSRKSLRSLFLVAALCIVVTAVSLMLLADMLLPRLHDVLLMDGIGIRARLWFWDGTLRMIRDNFLWGVGLGNFPYWSPRYLAEALADVNGPTHYHNDIPTLYAHCDILQLFAETGIVGVVLWLWMALRIRYQLPAVTGALVSLAVFSLTNFPFHSAPHALLGAVCLARLENESPTINGATCSGHRLARLAEHLFPLASLGFAAFVLWAVVQPSILLKTADVQYLRGDSQAALDAYEVACQHPWQTAVANRNYAAALITAGKYAEAENELRRALERSDIGQLYLALGVLSARRGDKDSARAMLEEALYRIPSNIEVWRRLLDVAPPEEREQLLNRARSYLARDEFERLANERSK